MLFPCTVVHEPPYQTYSSVWCAGFRRRFLRMNDRTDSTLVWGSLRLAPITFLIIFKLWDNKPINAADRPLNEAKVKVAAMVSVSTTKNYSPKIAITVKVSSLLRARR